MNVQERHETQCHEESGVFIVPLTVMVIYIYIYIYIYSTLSTLCYDVVLCVSWVTYDHLYIYTYDSQIVHHNPCFNLFILHNNSFDNQGREINKNEIFFMFRHM